MCLCRTLGLNKAFCIWAWDVGRGKLQNSTLKFAGRRQFQTCRGSGPPARHLCCATCGSAASSAGSGLAVLWNELVVVSGLLLRTSVSTWLMLGTMLGCFTTVLWDEKANLRQAREGLQFRSSCLASSYLGVTICGCLALRQAIGELHFAGSCRLPRVKILGNSNLQDPVWQITVSRLLSCRAFGELQFLRSCFASSYWRLQFARSSFAPSYLGITISSLPSCVKLLGNYNLQGLALLMLLANSNLQAQVVRQSIGELQLEGAIQVYHISLIFPPSCGDSCSNCVFKCR